MWRSIHTMSFCSSVSSSPQSLSIFPKSFRSSKPYSPCISASADVPDFLSANWYPSLSPSLVYCVYLVLRDIVWRQRCCFWVLMCKWCKVIYFAIGLVKITNLFSILALPRDWTRGFWLIELILLQFVLFSVILVNTTFTRNCELKLPVTLVDLG